MADRPNLFEEATSELSQDAFICWLVRWVNCGEDPQLQQHAKDFVAMLYNSTKRPDITGSDVERVPALDRQVRVTVAPVAPNKRATHARIDILFVATIAGTKHTFLVEDKTSTQHHSDQLAIYQKGVREKAPTKKLNKKLEPYVGKELVCVYYKSGYLFVGDEDEDPDGLGYGIVDHVKIADFFRRDSHNVIFNDYARHVSAISAKIEKALDGIENGNAKCLRHEAGQWSFALRIRDCLSDEAFVTNRGTNKGKQPYTELRFRQGNEIVAGVSEKLMYRIERLKSVPALSLRQYARLSKAAKGIDRVPLRSQKRERLQRFVAAYQMAKQSAPGLVWSDAPEDKVGKNSSRIGTLLLGEGENMNAIDDVIEHLPLFHGAFSAALEKDQS